MTLASDAIEVRFRRLDLAAAAAGDATAVAERRALVRRGAAPDPAVRERARSIVGDVRADGSAAVRRANAKFGGGRAAGRRTLVEAMLGGGGQTLPRQVRQALDQAIEHLTRFAVTQRPATTHTSVAPGIDIERRWEPLASVGAYVPGGSVPPVCSASTA